MPVLTVETDLLDRMIQPDFETYLRSLYPPNPETGTLETPEQTDAREAARIAFEAQFDAAYPLAERLMGGGLQCIFNCAKDFIECRRHNPNYPPAAICDAGAQQCFTQCFINW